MYNIIKPSVYKEVKNKMTKRLAHQRIKLCLLVDNEPPSLLTGLFIYLF